MMVLNIESYQAVVAHTSNPSTWMAEADGSLCVRGQLGLPTESKTAEDTQGNPVSKYLNE